LTVVDAYFPPPMDAKDVKDWGPSPMDEKLGRGPKKCEPEL
jgi:hypothetical protein